MSQYVCGDHSEMLSKIVSALKYVYGDFSEIFVS